MPQRYAQAASYVKPHQIDKDVRKNGYIMPNLRGGEIGACDANKCNDKEMWANKILFSIGLQSDFDILLNAIALDVQRDHITRIFIA